jgi:hypothetical protein
MCVPHPLSQINTLRYPSHAPVRRFLFRALGKFRLNQRDYRKSFSGLQANAGQAY